MESRIPTESVNGDPDGEQRSDSRSGAGGQSDENGAIEAKRISHPVFESGCIDIRRTPDQHPHPIEDAYAVCGRYVLGDKSALEVNDLGDGGFQGCGCLLG